MNEFKIVLTGPMGVGKTTAIAAISEIAPVKTDVQNNDSSNAKATTTVGLDYGELTLDNGDKLRLYGTPGQERFAFMWDIMAQGALGIIIMVDATRPDPVADMVTYLTYFRNATQKSGCIIAVGRLEHASDTSLEAFSERLEQLNLVYPVVPMDARVPQDVSMALELLITQLEAKL
jgi:uncharacterized protein